MTLQLVTRIEGAVSCYVQAVPSTEWIFPHRLDHQPTQVVITTYEPGTIQAEVSVTDTTMTVKFAELRTGRAEYA